MSTVNSTESILRTLADYNNEKASGSELLQGDFLELLMAQMKYQDPLEATSNTDFVAQLAQFSMLEQMQALSAEFSTSQAYNLIGKYVYVEGDKDTLICGKVEGVVKEKGENYLMVGDKQYELSSIFGVVDENVIEGTKDEQILQSANLIGSTVSADIIDEQTSDVTTVTGTVEKILIQNDLIYAVVNDQNILVSDITEITK